MKNSNETNNALCPVCGRMHVAEYDICDNCGWENDPVQAWKPTLPGGANQMSLEEAKAAYRKGMPIK